MQPLDAAWRVSTRTGTQGQCVEARFVSHRVEVRDSKDRDGALLDFSPTAWISFVASLDAGRTNRI